MPNILCGGFIPEIFEHSNMLVRIDASWYHDTFGAMSRYSCALYHSISSELQGQKEAGA